MRENNLKWIYCSFLHLSLYMSFTVLPKVKFKFKYTKLKKCLNLLSLYK